MNQLIKIYDNAETELHVLNPTSNANHKNTLTVVRNPNFNQSSL